MHWEYVRRLLPRRLIPEIPQNAAEGVTPSGWRAPRGEREASEKPTDHSSEKAPNLPYYIRRKANHLPSIFLERRRDELNPKTMDFEYVELVILTGIDGDVFVRFVLQFVTSPGPMSPPPPSKGVREGPSRVL